MLSFLRVIKFAIQDIFRNFSLSFMTILILVLMLLSVNILIFINVITSQAVRSVKDQLDVSIYFSHDASQEKIEEIKKFVGAFPEVVSISYLDSEQVLALFKEQHKDNPEILASLSELTENPLGPTMVVQTSEPQDYAKIISSLSIPEYASTIEAKTFGDTEKAIARIQTITGQAEKFALVVSVLFAFIAFLIIFNTIRVAIYTQRIEISIKKLVGATNWFVRGPYLVESFIFSLLSTFFSVALVFLALHILDPYVAVIFSQDKILFNYYLANSWLLLLAQFAAVFVLTIGSSMLAMRRHLRI